MERAFFMVRASTLDVLEHGLRPQTLALHERMLSEHPNVLGVHAVLASIYATQRDFDAAKRHFDCAAKDNFQQLPEDLTLISELTLLADAARRIGERERAQAVYEQLLPYGHLFDFLGGEAVPAGPVAYWLAELAIELGELDEAERWLARADDVNERFGATLFQHYANLARARLLLRRRSRIPVVQALIRETYAFAARTGVAQLRIGAQELEQEYARAQHEQVVQPK